LSVGPDPREVHELLDPEPVRLHRHALGTLHMQSVKRLFAAFGIQADRIYHAAHPSDRIGHRLRISDVTFDCLQPWIVGPEQRLAPVRVPRHDPHSAPLFMQSTNNASAEKARCAKDSDDRCGHGVPDIVKTLLCTREECDGSSGSDVPPNRSSELSEPAMKMLAPLSALVRKPLRRLWPA